MRSLITGTATGLALAATTLMAAAPAQADWHGGGRYYRGGHYHGGNAAAALGAGIAGLAIGAAIASPGPRYYYGPGPAYYAPPPPPAYYGYCHTEYRWDGYRGGYVPVRFCN